MLDYGSVAALLALPRLARWSPRVTGFVTASALGTLAYSALTRYELGVWPRLSMDAHLSMDAASGVLFCAAPLVFADEPPGVQAALAGIGLFELTVVALTQNG